MSDDLRNPPSFPPERKLRLCILTETYFPVVGGGEIQAQRLAEGLVVQGLQVLILTRRTDASLRKVETIGSITVYRLPPTGRHHLKKWGLLLSSSFSLFQLHRNYDIILVSGFRVVGVSAVLLAGLFGKPCFLKADNNGEMSGKFFAGGLANLRLSSHNWLVRKIVSIRNRILRTATGFVAISSDIQDEFMAHGVDRMAISYIPNCVDTSKFIGVTPSEKAALRSKLALPLDKTIFIYTGRLVRYKGIGLLVQVWKKLIEQNPDIALLLVGAGSLDIYNCEVDLKEYVRENSLQESVVFTGEVQNVQEFLQAADIFVFPTEKEAFGISLIEAMACGLPVVASSVGGIKNVLQDQKNGLLIEPANFEQLFESMEMLVLKPEMAGSLGREARKTVQNRFSTQVVASQYIELFHSFQDCSIRVFDKQRLDR